MKRGSLAEAKGAHDGVVILEGDWGGEIFVVARAAEVRCDEQTLNRLLLDLDERACPEDRGQGTQVWFKQAPLGAVIAGGMGGGRVTEDVWVHAELEQAGEEPGIRAVLSGAQPGLGVAEPDVEPHHRGQILRAYHERLPATMVDFGLHPPDSWYEQGADEIVRQEQETLSPRDDGVRWYGATLRNVVRNAGYPPWLRD